MQKGGGASMLSGADMTNGKLRGERDLGFTYLEVHLETRHEVG